MSQLYNYLAYSNREAAVAQMLDRGEAYASKAMEEESHLLWIELDHSQGELCVGLGRHVEAPEADMEPCSSYM